MKQYLTLANLLKICAVAVAAPRYVGAFSAAVGIDGIARYTWLADAEAYSGAAMAVLEGFAIAFVLSKWRLLKPKSTDWYVVSALAATLILTLPFVATPYLLASQTQQTIAQMLPDESLLLLIRVAWSFIVAFTPMLIVAAVGYADVNEAERKLRRMSTDAELRKAPRDYAQEQAEASLPYACPTCERRFSTPQGLAGHSRHCKPEASTEQNGKLPELEIEEL